MIHKMWRVGFCFNVGKNTMCVALFYQTDIGESLRSRGFLMSTDLRQPVLARSSPSTITTSLAIPISSSLSSNGPSN